MSIKSISIVGRGDFGGLVASLVPEGITHASYGSKDTEPNINEIARSDVIILSVPLAAYPQVLALLKPVIHPETLLVDVCSVKVKPAELIAHHLPDHQNVMLTHPLFGPQSWDNGKVLDLVITKTQGQHAKDIEDFCAKELKLRVLHMTNEEHDQRMAEVHALTFFIARGLKELDLKSEPFITPSFESLLRLVELNDSQTEALFQTIQNGNPFAEEERQKFMTALEDINNGLLK